MFPVLFIFSSEEKIREPTKRAVKRGETAVFCCHSSTAAVSGHICADQMSCLCYDIT